MAAGALGLFLAGQRKLLTVRLRGILGFGCPLRHPNTTSDQGIEVVAEACPAFLFGSALNGCPHVDGDQHGRHFPLTLAGATTAPLLETWHAHETIRAGLLRPDDTRIG